MHLFRHSVCFRNFPLKRRKQPETESVMVSLVKHQSVLLVCFNGSNIQSCSSFMIRTRFHTSVQAPLWHPRSFSSVLRPGGAPYNGLYWEATPERGTFFRLQIYERVETLLVAVYERVGKSVISVCEQDPKSGRILWLYKVGKTFYFCDCRNIFFLTVHESGTLWDSLYMFNTAFKVMYLSHAICHVTRAGLIL